jgi:hypothetical protein
VDIKTSVSHQGKKNKSVNAPREEKKERERKGIRLLNNNPHQKKTTQCTQNKKERKLQCNYSLKNPSPSYRLAGVPPIPNPRALPVGVVKPRRVEVGVGGIRWLPLRGGEFSPREMDRGIWLP